MQRPKPSGTGRRILCGLAAFGVVALMLAVPSGALAANPPHSPGSNAPVPGPGHKVTPRSATTRGALGSFTPSFTCKKPGHSHSVHVTANLSGVHVSRPYYNH